jgi:peptidoglycan pentaglycine glycine transferase (the first glycine)
MPELNINEWNDFLTYYPDAHLLQTSAWGELKKAFGWTVTRISSGSPPNRLSPDSLDLPSSTLPAGAQLMFRRALPGFSMAYLPKGPLFPAGPGTAPWEDLLPEIDAACRKRRAVFLKVEPDVWESQTSAADAAASPPKGFEPGQHAIQPQRTLLVDLRGSEDRIQSQMKQKTRYNIKLSQKKGVVVHPSADIDTFHRLLQVTGGRDDFGVHSLQYYRKVYELFHSRGECELLMASFEGEPLAGLMIFAYGRRAWYLYGASTSSHRDRMPNYILQWEAMRWAREQGCEEYDLWGVPDEEEAVLEEQFHQRPDGLWGVYRFKRGFGGQLCRAAGPWDRVYIPFLYSLYKLWIRRWGG